jgi:pyruvate dehydrogenase E2 component (dihydrolipoamide acetyltransferase)
MPQLGETVTEGTITKWHKQVGDTISEDEVLFEVSTDKVDSEVPSPLSGTVTEILVPEGETVAVGTKLAVISPRGGGAAAATTAAEAATAGPTAAGPTAAEAAQGPEVGLATTVPETPITVAETPTNVAETPTNVADAPTAPAEPAGITYAAQRGTSTGPAGTGPAGTGPAGVAKPPTGGPPRPGGRPADQRPPSAPAQPGPAKLLSPVVRRLISEHGLDPATIPGTGAGGRITRDDVLAAIERQGSGGNGAGTAAAPAEDLTAPSAAAAPAEALTAPSAAPSPAVPSAPAVLAGERDTVVPFTNIRRRTAEHMVRSKHTSAHTMVAFEVDYSAIDRVRLAEKEHFKAAHGFSLTYLPFIGRAVVDALSEWPYLNSSVGEDELIVHGEVNLGIAVDLNFEGLLVPVVHRAEEKRLVALAREMADLASRARARRLTMDDISGGTFTITNAGGFGTYMTVPVINQPQVAILSTDGVRKRPVAVELPDGSDGIAVRPMGNLVMSWDHRAVDGAYAAAFLARVREILETRDWSSEL